MDETITVRLVTPSSIILEREALMITMPGEEGIFGTLPGHASLIASLKAGITNITLKDNSFLRYFIDTGIAEVSSTNTNIITEFALDATALQQPEVIEKIASLKDELAKEADVM